MFELTYWFMFPVSILIALIAMSTITAGAAFFSPIFLLLGLEPGVAIGTALLTQTFGFATGLYFHLKQRLINFKVGTLLLAIALPSIVLGVFLSEVISTQLLKILIGFGVLLIGLKLLFKKPVGERLVYSPCKPFDFRGTISAALGGIALGAISIGLGELIGYHLNKKCDFPIKQTVSTTIFIVAIATFFASIGYLLKFVSQANPFLFLKVLSIVMFTIPGVMIGAFLGTTILVKRNTRIVTMLGTISLIALGVITLFFNLF